MKWNGIKNLTYLKRGKALNKARKKYIADGKQPGRGGDRKSMIRPAKKVLFDTHAAKQFGVSPRSILRTITIFRSIDKKCRKRLIGTWAEDNGTALAYIGQLTPEN